MTTPEHKINKLNKQIKRPLRENHFRIWLNAIANNPNIAPNNAPRELVARRKYKKVKERTPIPTRKYPLVFVKAQTHNINNSANKTPALLGFANHRRNLEESLRQISAVEFFLYCRALFSGKSSFKRSS